MIGGYIHKVRSKYKIKKKTTILYQIRVELWFLYKMQAKIFQFLPHG